MDLAADGAFAAASLAVGTAGFLAVTSLDLVGEALPAVGTAGLRGESRRLLVVMGSDLAVREDLDEADPGLVDPAAAAGFLTGFGGLRSLDVQVACFKYAKLFIFSSPSATLCKGVLPGKRIRTIFSVGL